MDSPRYLAPETLEDALNIKGERGADARLIAGGTDLILRMRDRVFRPKLLLDLSRVSLDHISHTGGEMRIGSCVTHSRILANADIETFFPALAESCRQFAGPPIRNRGTIGGNIANASPAADLVPPLLAYDAKIVLASVSGDRVLALTEFFTGPGETVMRVDEILTEVRLPLLPPDSAAIFIKLGQRRSMAISMVNLCVRLSLATDGTVAAARIALGAVAPTPRHAVAAQALLTGAKISPELLDQAARQASQEMAPISDARASGEYRKQMITVLVRRALTAVWKSLNREQS
jgi:CO/xanthine dehydrogenase FAD-binding subunit